MRPVPPAQLPGSRLYGLDIETDTRVNGLDPRVAPIIAVALATDELCEVFRGPETALLRELNASIESLPAGVIVTWNGGGFDLPFLAERARRRGVRLDLELCDDPGLRVRDDGGLQRRAVRATWGAHAHLDGFQLYRSDVGRALPLSCGLKPMARLLGLDPVQLDTSRLHDYTAEEVDRYVASDASLTRELVARRWPACATFVDHLPPRRDAPRCQQSLPS